MRRLIPFVAVVLALWTPCAMAATEETKQTAIDIGLEYLAGSQAVSGAEGYWPYANNGTLASTAAAALAFVEEGYLPGDASVYGDVVERACEYVFNRATVDGRFGVESAVYVRYAEDYDDDGVYDDGNDQAIYFEPGAANRRVYTTGIVAPLIYALGERLGRDQMIGRGAPEVAGMTYSELMQDVVDWFAWGQVEPNLGNYRGGWRYDANYSSSDNSTAQWGSLPLLYARDWSLGTAPFVFAELELWVNYIQNANGGSGYDNPGNIVNCAKTGGLLLELAAIGAPVGDPRVQAAIGFLNSRWNAAPSGTWYGNIGHPYAMWAVYKGLQVYGYLVDFDCSPGSIPIGQGIAAAPGGFPICFDASSVPSQAGDWYSHYSDYLCVTQGGGGGWSGYSYWTGALATGWNINILNATKVVQSCETFEIVIGTSWDGIELQEILDGEYGAGAIDVLTDYEGAQCGDASIPYWLDDAVDGWVVRELANFRGSNVLGWYAENFTMPVIDGIDDGVIFDGTAGQGDTAFVPLPGTTRFALYMNPNGTGDTFNAPEPEIFFTNRNYNDIGPDGSGALHIPEDGDVQALIYNITDLRDGIPTYVVAWEDIDAGSELSEVYIPGFTDNDYNDLVVEFRANSPVSIDEEDDVDVTQLTTEFSLRVAPNPFPASTVVTFRTPRKEPTRVAVYDARGREVDVLFDGVGTGREEALAWTTSRVAAGVYFIRIETDRRVVTEKVTMLH